MNNFMIIRNRTLHGLVLGLVVISFVAYFRTGSIEANLPTAALIHSRVGASEAQNVSLNGTVECPVTGSSRIASQDSSRRGGLQRGGNESTSQPVAPSSSIVQTSSMSSSPEGINVINETMSPDAIARMTNTSKETTATSTSTTTPSTTTRSYTYPPDSAGAMYRAGHDVTASGKCPSNGANLSLAIVIASAPGHVEARKAVRQTWGHYDQRKDIAIIFVLGTTNDTKLDKLLHLEEDLYGDIVRGRFVDSYSNLTLKTISSLEWIRNYCAGAKFVLKTDDDMFINVPRLLAFVQRRENERNVIFGRLARKWKPFRNKKSKYYVPFYQYKPAHFPDFTTGPAYLLSRDVVDKLFTAALEHTYLKLEDVFVAGIVAEKLGVRRIHANEFYNTRIAHTACNVQRAISIHMVKYKEQFDLWKKLLDGTTKCQ